MSDSRRSGRATSCHGVPWNTKELSPSFSRASLALWQNLGVSWGARAMAQSWKKNVPPGSLFVPPLSLSVSSLCGPDPFVSEASPRADIKPSA